MSDRENTSTIQALSEGLADAVTGVGAAVVRVNGRRRRPASGIVYAPGMVLTSSHAVEREEDLSVGTGDGGSLEASFVGRDHATDLAVLRVEGLETEPAPPAGAARVGQLALAVGRAGRSGDVRASLGVVSAVGGPLRTGRGARLERYVQTDATPYPGLSGGPLVDVGGGVLGILTTAFGRGVTFAVPADIAWGVASNLEAGGTVERGYLGILSQPVALPGGEGEAQRGGLLVVGVEEGSPAGQGGLLLGDVVTALDSVEVEDTEDLLALLVGDRVGKTVKVAVVRGGEPASVEVTVGKRPERRGRRGRRG